MKLHLNKEPNLQARKVAFDYQLEAFKAIKDLDYCAIFHEQGLGKTKIAIDLMLYWLENKLIDTVVIVAKKSLIPNWMSELKEHCYIKPVILTQDKKANYYVFNSPSRLILANYEAIRSEHERMELFLRARDIATILDESAKIKNPESAITQTFFELASSFKKRVIMTGTPVANRPYDIWAQIWFLDQGRSLGNDFYNFKNNLDLTNDLADDEEKKFLLEREMNSIFQKISEFTVRETKNSGIISLPKKIYHKVLTEWESYQHELYGNIRQEMKAIILKDGIPTEDISENTLKRLLRLVQVASNPRIIDETYNLEPGKLIYLKNIIYDIVKNKEKCIIWSSFTHNIDWLAMELKEFGTSKVYGKMDIYSRTRNIDKFKTDSETAILIATPGAAKEGLTLTVANHVIFYDRSFSLDDYLQAQDRIHRISQSKTCNVYNLIMKDSIDEWIDVLLNAKELAAKLTQGDISLDYYRSQMSYSYGDILRNILNIHPEQEIHG